MRMRCYTRDGEAHLAQVNEEGRRGERRRGEQEKQRSAARVEHGTGTQMQQCGRHAPKICFWLKLESRVKSQCHFLSSPVHT